MADEAGFCGQAKIGQGAVGAGARERIITVQVYSYQGRSGWLHTKKEDQQDQNKKASDLVVPKLAQATWVGGAFEDEVLRTDIDSLALLNIPFHG